MDPPPPQIEIVVVGPPRLPDAPGQRAFSTYDIAPELLDSADRIDDAVLQTPGVSLFRRNGSGAANPTIQGVSVRSIGSSGAGRALVTLDGAPLNDAFGGWVIWGAEPPELLSRATVSRGAGAGPYGAGALTGTIALGERSGPGFGLNADGGSLGFARASVFGEIQNGNVDLLFAGASEHNDGWIPVDEGRGAVDTPLSLDARSGVARVSVQRGRITAAARIAGYDEDRGTGVNKGVASDSGGAASFTLVAAPAPGEMGWRVQVWAQQSDLSNPSFSVARGRNTATPANLQQKTPATGWGANISARWGASQSGFEVGADVRHTEGDTHELFSFNGAAFTRTRVAGGETLVAGVYAETWKTLGDWLLTGGARVDSWRAYDGRRLERLIATGATTLDVSPSDTSDVAPTARVAVRRGFGALYVRSAVYSGFRPPTLNELHRPFRVGNDVTEANPALSPEKLYGGDAGIGADFGHWSWDAGVFVNRLDDAITNVTLGVGPGVFPPGVTVPAGGAYRQRRNVGHIAAVGIEANIEGDIRQLTWRAALDYTHAEVDGASAAAQLTGLRPAQSPQWSATGFLEWRFNDLDTLGATLRYEGARFDDDLNTRRLGSALTIDLAYQHRLTGSTVLFVAIDNASDAEVETAAQSDGTFSLAAPRTWRAGLRVRL